MQISLAIKAPTQPTTIQRAITTLAGLFRTGVQGVWYDPSDFTTLFQDSAGTTPVTAVEQSVGLMLDKSKGLVLGSEKVTNGGFNTNTDWTLALGHTISGGVLNIAAAITSLSSSPTASGFYEIGKTYKITYTISAYSAGSVRVVLGAASGSIRSANGTYTEYLVGASLSGATSIQNIGATTLAIDNITIKELAGNHATQPTAINRPVLSARVNQLTQTENLTTWSTYVPANSSVIPNYFQGTAGLSIYSDPAGLGDDPSKTATTPTVAGTPVSTSFLVDLATVTGAVIHTVLGFVSGGGTAYARFNITTAGAASVSLQVGVTGSTITATNLYGTVWSIKATTIFTAANTSLRFYLKGNDLTSFICGRPQLEIGSVATRYQRINTATDYDTVGFKHYLKFNGTNSGMSTGNINFAGTDKMMVCAGVRKLSDAIDQATIVELGTNSSSTAGSFALQCSPAFTGRYRMQLFGSSRGVRDTLLSTYAAPNTAVLTMLSDIVQSTISQEIIARANGAVLSMDNVLSPAGTGNFGNYPLYIGARAGTSLFFNGNIHGLIVAGTAATPAQIAAAERIINDDTGAY